MVTPKDRVVVEFHIESYFALGPRFLLKSMLKRPHRRELDKTPIFVCAHLRPTMDTYSKVVIVAYSLFVVFIFSIPIDIRKSDGIVKIKILLRIWKERGEGKLKVLRGKFRGNFCRESVVVG